MGVTEGVGAAVGVIVGVPVVVALGVMVAVIEVVMLIVEDKDGAAPGLPVGEGVAVTMAERVGVPVPETVEVDDGVLVWVGENDRELLFVYCNSSNS